MKQSVVKSTLAVAFGLGLIASAGVVEAQTLRLTHAYSDVQGNASASPTNYLTVYGARIEGATAFEVRSVSFRVFYHNSNTPNAFEVSPGRVTSTFIKTFNAGPDGAPGTDGNDATNQFGVGNPTFTDGFPLRGNNNTIPAGWAPGSPAAGAFEPLLIIGFPNTPSPLAFGVTGNPPTSSGVVARPWESTATGSFITNANTIGLSNTDGGAVLAVEMIDLSAKATGTGVLVSWETGLEIDNAGFNVYSQPQTAAAPQKLNPILIGAAGTAASYSYLDSRPLGSGEVRAYYVEDVDVTGLATTLHGPAFAQGGVSANVGDWNMF